MTKGRPGPRPAGDGRKALHKLLFHPAGLSALDLRVWTILRAEPGLGVCAVSSRSGHHRKSVARAVNRLVDQGLARDVSPTPDRRDPSTGQLIPTRFVALDPPTNVEALG